jgi:hypothetical protein
MAMRDLRKNKLPKSFKASSVFKFFLQGKTFLFLRTRIFIPVCQGRNPEIAPYAIELMFMRDPQDNLSMVLPYNEPLLINLVDTWEDGTRTLPYYIHGDKNIFIKHIFTCNLPLLQIEATRLLHFIQLEVELVRPIGENSMV